MTLVELINHYRAEYESAVERNDDPEVIYDLWVQWQETESMYNAFAQDLD